jgi:hypothetical protein
MTHNDFNHILGSINTLSPDQMRQLRSELDSKLAESETTRLGRRESDPPDTSPAPKSILEMVDELRKKVPPEEFSKLPTDGARQLDHYLYGSPKRPPA